MRQFVADFETTTDENDCRVWAFAICEIGNPDNLIIGTTIDDFMKWCEVQPDNVKIYFHNLRFDISFIFNWLFRNEFRHVTSKERESRTFTTVISNRGLFYACEVIFYLNGKKVNKVTFWDSMKLIPLSVEEIAKTFKFKEQKLKIDYDAHNNLPVGAPLTDEEKEYIIHDVRIVAHAIEYFQAQGLDRMTIGSCALNEYKNLIEKKNFNLWFPVPKSKCHNEIKESYKGGWSYTNPWCIGKEVGCGLVLDKNSMYPWVMKTKLLPWGTPIFYRGEYKRDPSYPLYVQMIRCQFEIKPGMLPTIQIKHTLGYSGTEYLTSSNFKEETLFLTNIDLELFKKHYNVYNIEYLSGWKFRGGRGMFDAYIDKWYGKKNDARAEGNSGLEFIAKLYLNNLSGKFGTSNMIKEKQPYIGEDGAVHYRDSKPEEKNGIYIAMSSFITSYARYEEISCAQKIEDDFHSGKSKNRFLYGDTDSLHILSPEFEFPEGLQIDRFELGAWKVEGRFRRAKFLRSKCYIEDFTKDMESENPEYAIKVTVAGMPDSCKEQVNFKNFKIGATYTGKKQPKAVQGGVVLQDIDFSIKKV